MESGIATLYSTSQRSDVEKVQAKERVSEQRVNRPSDNHERGPEHGTGIQNVLEYQDRHPKLGNEGVGEPRQAEHAGLLRG